MSHEHHVISRYSVRHYPRFHVTAVGLGTYYPQNGGPPVLTLARFEVVPALLLRIHIFCSMMCRFVNVSRRFEASGNIRQTTHRHVSYDLNPHLNSAYIFPIGPSCQISWKSVDEFLRWPCRHARPSRYACR